MPNIGGVALCIADACSFCGVPLARKCTRTRIQGFERSFHSRSAPLAKLWHAVGVLRHRDHGDALLSLRNDWLFPRGKMHAVGVLRM